VARSVLRVSDQRRERFPDVCVLSGERTSHAVRLTAVAWNGPRWLLGVPGLVPVVGLLPGHDRAPVALPVSPRVWRLWQRRNALATTGVVVGVLWTLLGVILASGTMMVFGAIVAVIAGAYRTRTVVNFWVTCRLDSSAGTIIVEPTHRIFDQAAAQLFISSI
jgi:hypothetical protein